MNPQFSLLIESHTWGADWVWGIPMIVLTVTIHVLGLGLIRRFADLALDRNAEHCSRTGVFAVALGATTLLVTVLHGIEAALWAAWYWLLQAMPDTKSAMLYSLNAITSYGHTTLTLPHGWELLGSLEALNGWLLFGLTTAFLFAVIEQFEGSPYHTRSP